MRLLCELGLMYTRLRVEQCWTLFVRPALTHEITSTGLHRRRPKLVVVETPRGQLANLYRSTAHRVTAPGVGGLYVNEEQNGFVIFQASPVATPQSSCNTTRRAPPCVTTATLRWPAEAISATA